MGRRTHTFSIALLVGTPFHTLLPLLAHGVNAFLADSVLDTAKARAGIVALLACFLAVCARILDLSALRTRWLGCILRGEGITDYVTGRFATDSICEFMCRRISLIGSH